MSNITNVKSIIPLFNPKQELIACGEVLFNKIQDVANNGIYVNGDRTAEFENCFTKKFQAPFAVAVSSGTTALELMLRAEEVGHGNRVVTSAHTFVAVLEAILHVGAEPLLIDIDPHTWQMPAGNWSEEVVIVSHLYGGASAAIESQARLLYEDASQSLGATLNGNYLGTLSRVAAVSLYPTKNLSAMGDAGIILTSNEKLANRLRAIRNHGQIHPQVHDYCGTTARMDEIQAVILKEKLGHFDKFLTARRNAAKYYDEYLCDLPLKFPLQLEGTESAPNLYIVRCSQRNELKQFMAERGIISGIHYPTPFHLMPAYKNQAWAQVTLPHTEQLCDEILSLPLWVGILEEQQSRVVSAIREFFNA